uniref:Uncharacterized protein n=1 Tax=Octopus bimaculoides TaxID=37653 RepID=A0A0L8GH25_OCTBM
MRGGYRSQSISIQSCSHIHKHTHVNDFKRAHNGKKFTLKPSTPYVITFMLTSLHNYLHV